MFPETLETPSLRLERLCRDRVDVREFYEVFAAHGDHADAVFEHVPQEPYETPKEARDKLADAEESWEAGETAEYAVYADGDLAGYTGLVLEWDRRTGRLGAILDRPHWGNGYAGECASALTELAFDRLDLELVEIGHEAGNERSKRFIEGFVDEHGGQYDGVLRNWTPMADEVRDQHRYTITRESFERAREK
ncbi:MAG: GNAT family N-acetyltransferase [Halobacterium sp.]